MGSNKKQKRGRIISNLTKGETFSSPMTTKCSCRFSQCGPTSCTHQKRRSPPFQFGQEKNIPGHSIENRAYWIILNIASMFPILTTKNKIMNIFIIDNILLQKGLPSPSSLARSTMYLGIHLKEELTTLFRKLFWYSLA